MAVPGNKAAADMGRSNYPANDVGNMFKYKADVATKGKDTALRNLAQKRISYKKRPPRNDIMPKGARKVADFGAQVIGGATQVGSNVDALLKVASSNRLKLPKIVRRGLNNPLSAVSAAMEKVTKRK